MIGPACCRVRIRLADAVSVVSGGYAEKATPYSKEKNVLVGRMYSENFDKLKSNLPLTSVVEPEPPYLAGAGAVKNGAAPAPALQLKLQL